MYEKRLETLDMPWCEQSGPNWRVHYGNSRGWREFDTFSEAETKLAEYLEWRIASTIRQLNEMNKDLLRIKRKACLF